MNGKDDKTGPSGEFDLRRQILPKVTGAGIAALGALSVLDGRLAVAQDISSGAANFYTSEKVTLQKAGIKAQYERTLRGLSSCRRLSVNLNRWRSRHSNWNTDDQYLPMNKAEQVALSSSDNVTMYASQLVCAFAALVAQLQKVAVRRDENDKSRSNSKSEIGPMSPLPRPRMIDPTVLLWLTATATVVAGKAVRAAATVWT